MTDNEILEMVRDKQESGDNKLSDILGILDEKGRTRLLALKRRGKVAYVNTLDNNTLNTYVVLEDQ